MQQWEANAPIYYSKRRTRRPDTIVIHAMGEFVRSKRGDLLAPQFLDRVELSAHAFVSPSGVLIRSVPDDRVAFHAGSRNATSFGIEFLVPGVHDLESLYAAMDGPDWVTDQQLDAGARQVAEWLMNFDLLPSCIVRHSEIDPERKRDPGRGFPWAWFLHSVRGYL